MDEWQQKQYSEFKKLQDTDDAHPMVWMSTPLDSPDFVHYTCEKVLEAWILGLQQKDGAKDILVLFKTERECATFLRRTELLQVRCVPWDESRGVSDAKYIFLVMQENDKIPEHLLSLAMLDDVHFVFYCKRFTKRGDMSTKETLAKQYNCQPSDIDVKVTHEEEENVTTTTVTVSAPVNIEGDFNM